MELERRLMIYCVSTKHILSMFNAKVDEPGRCAMIAKGCGLPDGAFVRHVNYSMSRDCFELAVYHPSFPLTATGLPLPYANDSLWVEMVAVEIGQRVEAGTP